MLSAGLVWSNNGRAEVLEALLRVEKVMSGSMSFAEGDLYVVFGLRRILDFGKASAEGPTIVLVIVTVLAKGNVS